jgi:hypothetical protein
MAWTVAYVYYHDDGGNPLLLECLAPAARLIVLGGLARGWYFRRHWLRGPHVRLHLQVDDPGRLRAVESALRGAVAEFVARRPSRGRPTEAELRPAHELLANLELCEGPLLPLEPDNSVRFGPDMVDPDAYGGPEGLEVARRFLCGSSRLVLDWLASRRDDPSGLAGDVLDLLVLLARYLRDAEGIPSSYLSYRSHSEAFLNAFDRDGRLRAAFDQRYRAQAPAVRAVAAAYLRSGPILTTRATAGWLELLNVVYPDILRGADSGAISPPEDFDRRTTAIGRGRIYGSGRPISQFHQAAAGSRLAVDYARSSGYRARRVLVSLVYHGLLQLGLSPVQKYLACHMVANAIDELTGASWREIFASGDPDA